MPKNAQGKTLAIHPKTWDIIFEIIQGFKGAKRSLPQTIQGHLRKNKNR